MKKNKKGLLVIIAGPAGSGKDTIIHRLLEMNKSYKLALSWTTREQRHGERDGDIYHFVTKREFSDAVSGGKFLEWALVHERHYYGTLKSSVVGILRGGRVVIREVTIAGIRSLREKFQKEQMLVIFLTVASWSELKKRIIARAPIATEEIARRKRSYEYEMKAAPEFADYLVENPDGKVEDVIQQIDGIIKSELKKRNS
ncbi:MAG TPA: guanylate kinase [Patescibacteria group bacterium]|nr:guanylate kinase [Patescibacteria group bacterium]